MKEIKISEMIKRLRTDKEISQETLADVCGVSMQAVSKWENGLSCPDITFLPLLAEYFDVSIDYLLTGQDSTAKETDTDIASAMSGQAFKEDTLYIVQYRNGKLLDKTLWETAQPHNKETIIPIRFDEAFSQLQSGLHVEIWGSADIEIPDIKMSDPKTSDVNINLSAGGNVSCGGDIKGSVSAGASVDCDTIKGNVSAGNSVNCDTVKGDVSAGCSISCSSIAGDASAGTYISCDNINGTVKAGTHINPQSSHL